MKETITYCDVCGKADAETRAFNVDRRMDPAGSMDDVTEYLDLCATCSWMSFVFAVHPAGLRARGDYPTQKRVYEELKRLSLTRKVGPKVKDAV